MAGNERFVNLVVRAQDQYSRVIKNAGTALDQLSRKQQLQGQLGIKKEIRELESAYAKAGAEAKQYALALKEATGAGKQNAAAARENAIALVLTRARAQEAKTAIAAQRIELQKAIGTAQSSFRAFSKNADSMDVTANAAARLKTQLASAQSTYASATAAASKFMQAQQGAAGISNLQKGNAEIQRAREAKSEIAQVQAQLSKLSGSANGTFLAFSRTADGMQLVANEALDLKPATEQVVSATNRLIVSQRGAKAARPFATVCSRWTSLNGYNSV